MQERAVTIVLGWLMVLAGTACRASSPAVVDRAQPVAVPAKPTDAAPAAPPALPLDRIAVIGASVSAGLGGMPFGDAFTAAAPRSAIEDGSNVRLFQDPIAETRKQIERAIAFRATTIVGLDLMFWNLYGSTDPRWRQEAQRSALATLERARQAGAWIVIGDVPHIVTASELLISREAVPTAADVAAYNAALVAWGARERVLIVPFAAWAEPLAKGETTELAPGERVPARDLVTPDGLHPNALGVWALLDRLDRHIETTLPGTPKDALVFQRPPRS